jgi:hypothetical protein
MPLAVRKLHVFLCHASQDKPAVRELRLRLESEGWIETWLDEKKLLPGEDWRLSIEKAVDASDIVIICLSNNSVSKEGFVQKELRYAREIALEKPSETIFLIPLRLDECDVPRGLRFFQWSDYFGEKKDQTYIDLLQALDIRRNEAIRIETSRNEAREKIIRTSPILERNVNKEDNVDFEVAKKTKEKMRVFLCHAQKDKPLVRELYRKLASEEWIDPWLDEEKLYPGQDWDFEIEKAVKLSDAVLVCLSTNSVDKEGYIQRELRYVLRIAEEKSEGSIFVIPLRINDCLVPTRIREWQYVDYFPKGRKEWAYNRIVGALKLRQSTIK